MTESEPQNQIEDRLNDFLNKKHVWSEISDKPIVYNDAHIDFTRKLFSKYLSSIIPDQLKKDLEYLLLYKISDEKTRKKILDEWCSRTNSDLEDATKMTAEFDDGSCYRAVYDLVLYDKMTNGLFLPTILDNLKKLEKYNYNLDFKEACHYLKLHSLLTYTVPLDETEIKIIELLSKDSLISNREAALRIGVSRNTFSSKVLRLQKLGCIFYNGRLNLDKIGMKFLLIMTDQVIPKLPYMRLVQELRGGSTVYLYSFNLPEDYLMPFVDAVKPHLRSAEYLIVDEPGRHSLSLRNSYDTINKRWAFNLENWALWVRKVLHESWHAIYVSGDVEASEASVEPTSTVFDYDLKDLELLNQLIYDFKRPVRDLAKNLGISISNVFQRKNSLIKNGVIKPTLFVENIGLDEHVFIKIKGSDKLINSVEAGLLDLPSVYIFRVRDLRGERYLIAYLFLPKGSLVVVDYTLKQYLENIGEDVDFKLFYRLKQNYLSQGLPYSFDGVPLYKEHLKKWILPQKRIMEILKA